mmetsp:Transcript_5342/g.7947  ORF Transcript_5342/g.7947 Transcript_5342/m.7947 type:complete len:167 (-) Transcript_5342:3463-3963(-)
MNKVLGFAFLMVKLSEGRLRSVKDDENVKLLLTTLYKEKCVGDNYTRYLSPIDQCYNGMDVDDYHFLMRSEGWNKMIGMNNPYGENDILDTLILSEVGEITGICRSFYHSTNGTCSGDISDSFPNLPLDTCIGPFGEPLPWGMLELVQSNISEDNQGEGITSFVRR